jgi:hypothetical protein
MTSGAITLETANSPSEARSIKDRAAGGVRAACQRSRIAQILGRSSTQTTTASGRTQTREPRRKRRGRRGPARSARPGSSAHPCQMQPADGIEPRLRQQAQMLQVALAPAAVTGVEVHRVCGASSALPLVSGSSVTAQPARRIHAASTKSWLRQAPPQGPSPEDRARRGRRGRPRHA